ncbi:hypothetical protein SUGI_0859260 [Cryptomeria japonica]|nr:hypothetical protein SUGI_0859260 [Cryptomeria japonica]
MYSTECSAKDLNSSEEVFTPHLQAYLKQVPWHLNRPGSGWAEAMRPVLCSRSRAGFTLNIIYTPGLIEGGFVNDHALDLIKRFLTNKIIDVLLYVDRLDSYRVDNLDKQIIKAISDTFVKQIWQRSLVVFTHAQLSPPDGLSYADFVERRSAALHDAILEVAGFKKSDIQTAMASSPSNNSGGSSVAVVIVIIVIVILSCKFFIAYKIVTRFMYNREQNHNGRNSSLPSSAINVEGKRAVELQMGL